jgi:hypothetical protein
MAKVKITGLMLRTMVLCTDRGGVIRENISDFYFYRRCGFKIRVQGRCLIVKAPKA